MPRVSEQLRAAFQDALAEQRRLVSAERGLVLGPGLRNAVYRLLGRVAAQRALIQCHILSIQDRDYPDCLSPRSRRSEARCTPVLVKLFCLSCFAALASGQRVSVALSVENGQEFEPINWRAVAASPAMGEGALIQGLPVVVIQASVDGRWYDLGGLPAAIARRNEGKKQSGLRRPVVVRRQIQAGESCSWRGVDLDWRCSGFAGNYRMKVRVYCLLDGEGPLPVTEACESDWREFSVAATQGVGQTLRVAREQGLPLWGKYKSFCDSGLRLDRVLGGPNGGGFAAIVHGMHESANELTPAQSLLLAGGLPPRLKSVVEFSESLRVLQLARSRAGEARLSALGVVEEHRVRAIAVQGVDQEYAGLILLLASAEAKGDAELMNLTRGQLASDGAYREMARFDGVEEWAFAEIPSSMAGAPGAHR